MCEVFRIIKTQPLKIKAAVDESHILAQMIFDNNGRYNEQYG